MVREACAQWPKRVVVAVDAREGKVSVEGWTEDTSADAVEVGLAVARAGAGAVLYTDIGRDGMRTGPNLDATKRLARAARAVPRDRLGRRVAAHRPRRAPRHGCLRRRHRQGAVRGRVHRRRRHAPRARTRDLRSARKRVIPCLDVADGRVKKGVRFVELRDAGDPVEPSRPPTTRRAPTRSASSTSRPRTRAARTLLDVVRAHRRRVFLPLTVGGGVRSVDDVRQLLLAGADKVGHQHGRRRRSRPRAPRRRRLRQPGHRRRHRRPARSDGAAGRRAGRSSRTAAARRRGSTPSPGASAWPPRARARSSSRAWTATAPATASTSRSRAPSPTASRSP